MSGLRFNLFAVFCWAFDFEGRIWDFVLLTLVYRERINSMISCPLFAAKRNLLSYIKLPVVK